MTRNPFRPLVICATLAVVLAVGLFMASNSIFVSRVSAASNPRKLHLVERVTNEHIIDIGSTGDSPGDLDVFSNPVYDAANTKQIGHDAGSCIRTLVGQAYECNWTIFLKDGQISVEGPYYDNADSMLAVIGGTGRYSKVHGEMKLHARGNPVGSEYDYVLFLG
ncbi:MAG TPA: allene oxide cyclase family protein [Ktedonobacteraceae bacterium]|nr:allene oxide cyclase family protein [Ktedonobacteraceae bacterium]